MHSANESVYITGKLGAKMGIPVMDHGEGIPAENSAEDIRFGGKKKRNDHEARRKLFSYLLRHQEWNWDYRFLIVRTPR